uniref:Peptidase A2 domain-containing protein n=1 Tax=Heligmosomoides polygyrus TaxID=6339 RepID=A0A183GIZ5_HELPZ
LYIFFASGLRRHNTGDQDVRGLSKMDPLSALLQAVQKQLDLQSRRMDEQGATMKIMEKLSALYVVRSTLVIKDNHAIFDSLHCRIENSATILNEDALLTSDSSATSPKQSSELSWSEILEVMERQFGSAKTLFRRRLECFKMRYEGQEFNNYELLIKTKWANAKLNAMDFDSLQCLVYAARFQGPEFADYHIHLLRKLDQSEKDTLKDFTAECQLIRSYKEDSQMLEGDPSVNLILRKRTFQRKKKHVQRNEPHAIRYLSDPKEPKQRSGSTIRYCRNRQVNNVVAALIRNDHPHLDVFINSIELLLDTGAEITIIS